MKRQSGLRAGYVAPPDRFAPHRPASSPPPAGAERPEQWKPRAKQEIEIVPVAAPRDVEEGISPPATEDMDDPYNPRRRAIPGPPEQVLPLHPLRFCHTEERAVTRLSRDTTYAVHVAGAAVAAPGKSRGAMCAADARRLLIDIGGIMNTYSPQGQYPSAQMPPSQPLYNGQSPAVAAG